MTEPTSSYESHSDASRDTSRDTSRDESLHVTLVRPIAEAHSQRQWTGTASLLFDETGAPSVDPEPFQKVGVPGSG